MTNDWYFSQKGNIAHLFWCGRGLDLCVISIFTCLVLISLEQVIYKTLSPQWHQTFEFPDDGSLLALYVKDHNALLPTSSIGNCIVEYQRLPPNEMSDKWIPLQGVKKGEIRVQVTRKIPQLPKKVSDSESPSSRGHKISSQVRTCLFELFYMLYLIWFLEHIIISLLHDLNFIGCSLKNNLYVNMLEKHCKEDYPPD